MQATGQVRDVGGLVVARVGRVRGAGGGSVPWRVDDVDGVAVAAVTEFLTDMAAGDASSATLRSYAFELLGWLRFLWTVGVAWDRAERAEARENALWLKQASKPSRQRRADTPTPGTINVVTGKRHPGEGYAAATRRHARAVVRAFYEYHRTEHGRPLLNPFPTSRAGTGSERTQAGHNPMRPWTPTRPAPYQPRAPRRIPRDIPQELFNKLFAALSYDRDRALLAFWMSTAARASELLTARQGLVAPADQLIGVVRKGSRAVQMLPASPDAFVWLRLYHHRLGDQLPVGPDEPVWWTLRRPLRPLTYDAARMMFTRAQQALGSNWSLHDVRHTALKRMARDPHMSLTDVQWVAGHAHITSTEIYLEPSPDEVATHVLAHHARQAARPATPPPPAPGYRPEVLAALLGTPPVNGGTA